MLLIWTNHNIWSYIWSPFFFYLRCQELLPGLHRSSAVKCSALLLLDRIFLLILLSYTTADRGTQTAFLDHLVKRLQLTFEPRRDSIAENQWGASRGGETTPYWDTGLRTLSHLNCASLSTQTHIQHSNKGRAVYCMHIKGQMTYWRLCVTVQEKSSANAEGDTERKTTKRR